MFRAVSSLASGSVGFMCPVAGKLMKTTCLRNRNNRPTCSCPTNVKDDQSHSRSSQWIPFSGGGFASRSVGARTSKNCWNHYTTSVGIEAGEMTYTVDICGLHKTPMPPLVTVTCPPKGMGPLPSNHRLSLPRSLTSRRHL